MFAVASLVGGCLLLPAVVIAPPMKVLLFVGLSTLAELSYAACLVTAYERGALSLVYPIGRGTAPLIVTVGGWLLFRQAFHPAGLIGAVVLGLGLLFVGVSGVTVAGGSAIGFAVLTGISIAAYSLIDAHAVRYTAPEGYLGTVLLLEGLLLALWIGHNWDRWRRAMGPGVTVGFGTVVAYLLVLFAFQRAPTGPVATLREVSVLFALLLARERVRRRVWFAAGLVVVGAVLVAM